MSPAIPSCQSGVTYWCERAVIIESNLVKLMNNSFFYPYYGSNIVSVPKAQAPIGHLVNWIILFLTRVNEHNSILLRKTHYNHEERWRLSWRMIYIEIKNL